MSQSLPWSPETTFDTDSNVPTEYSDESSGLISLQFGNSDIMEFNSINEFIELDHSNVSYEQDSAIVSPLPSQPSQKVQCCRLKIPLYWQRKITKRCNESPLILKTY